MNRRVLCATIFRWYQFIGNSSATTRSVSEISKGQRLKDMSTVPNVPEISLTRRPKSHRCCENQKAHNGKVSSVPRQPKAREREVSLCIPKAVQKQAQARGPTLGPLAVDRSK